jgi:hypothetical protein
MGRHRTCGGFLEWRFQKMFGLIFFCKQRLNFPAQFRVACADCIQKLLPLGGFLLE